MDQDSFRTLLSSAPAPRTGTGRAAGVLGTTAPKRAYGGSSGTKVKDLQKKEEKTFVPRKTSKKNDKYQDRAEMRRLGKEDEFNEMEQMLAEFEKNARESGETEEEIERKRAYLGGDASHSILVKGLDFSLLAARKAELAQEEGGKAEDELDGMLDQGIGGSGLAGGEPIDEEVLGAKGTKRGLEDLFDSEVKKKKKRVKVGDDATAGGPGKPILPSKFKSISATTAIPATEGKLRKKKKKKVVPKAEESKVDKPAPTIESPRLPEEPVAGPSRAPAPMPSKRPSPPPPHPIVKDEPMEDDEDDDIFGGVGTYDNPLESSDDDSEDEDKPRKAPETTHRDRRSSPERSDQPAVRTKQGKGWFGDDPEENALLSLPSNALDGVLKSVAGVKSRRATEDHAASGSDSDTGDVHKPLARLQGLSSSALPSAKELLEMDAAASAADKRREKKAKWRAKQGLAAQDKADDDDDDEGGRGKSGDMDEQQKLNRDVQQLSAYMEKKEKKTV